MVRHDDEIVNLEFLSSNVRTQDINEQVRVGRDCKSWRPRLVFVVVKNVREELRISFASAFRAGLAMMQRLKPNPILPSNGTTEVVP